MFFAVVILCNSVPSLSHKTGLTSQDINNTAVPLALKRAMDEVRRPHAGRRAVD